MFYLSHNGEIVVLQQHKINTRKALVNIKNKIRIDIKNQPHTIYTYTVTYTVPVPLCT